MKHKITRINQIAKENEDIIFTSIYHLIDYDLIRECYDELDRNKVTSLDKITKDIYLMNLDENLNLLVNKLKIKQYKPSPSRSVYIPKTSEKFRSLAISNFESKIVQLALKKVLEAIFEPRFSSNMYGFRHKMGIHDALVRVVYDIEYNNTNYVLKADIKGYFDNIDYDILINYLKTHIKDTNILILIRKFLTAGILDKDKFYVDEYGAPHGSMVSPILANIYMYYCLIEWFENDIRPNFKGFANIINYADNFICCFEREDDAEKFYKVLLPARLKESGLELEPDKTKLIKFGRFARQNVGKPEIFDFLGFTHYCSTGKNGKFRVKKKTSGKIFNRKLVEFNIWCKENRTRSLDYIMATVRRKLTEYYNYYGITDNSLSVNKFYNRSINILLKWLNRRSQRMSFTREKFRKFLNEYKIPKPIIKVNMYELVEKQLEE